VNRAELLDPEAWAAILETFARGVDVAVALAAHDGTIIGRVHNAKPIWKLARAARPDWRGCAFCLDDAGDCTATADAEQARSLVMICGLGGFAHTAFPIFLEDQHMGTLLAGQVFDQYPDFLVVEQVAIRYGLSSQECWELALKSVPLSRATLKTYGNLLGTLGQAYLRERHATILKKDLAKSNCALTMANNRLTAKVAELDQSNAEKDILLNEVHHRVNNNLTVIGGLLRMQARAFPDDRVAEALRGSQLRLESMALIHAHLYNSTDWRAVNFAAYGKVLAENLFEANGVDQSRIRLRIEIGSLELGVDKAIPAGLILNELISNALKHAFPSGRSGVLFIEGKLDGDRVTLSVIDDGVGISKPTVEPFRKSLGMKIIQVLCGQLKGTFDRPPESGESGIGSIFRVSFPIDTASRAAAS
jgi:two-component sensor histidine kinase/ligand-binding sensor protein